MQNGMDKKIKKKKWTVKYITTISLFSIFFLFILYQIIFKENRSKVKVDSDRITVSTVVFDKFQEYIPVTGVVIPLKTIYLDAIEGGRVAKKFVEAGTMVEEGDSLLELENTNLLLDIMYREAELFQASNNLRNTRLAMLQNELSLQGNLIELDYQLKQLERLFNTNSKLSEKNLIPIQELERSRDEYENLKKRKKLAIRSFEQDSLFRNIQIGQLEASLVRMTKNMSIAKQKLDNLVIKAPVSGHLTSLNAEIGESKSRGGRFGQIDVLSGFKVRARIDEHYLPRINMGQLGEFDFAGKSLKLMIKKIFPEIREGRFDVDLEFKDETPFGIRRGQTAHIRLELGNLTETLLLARGGFYQNTGGQWVYRLQADGKTAIKQSIQLGRQNPKVFEVLSGLSSGDKIVTSSYDNFGDNEMLILVNQ